MENRNDPLIFIVEDNSIYNRLIMSHLRSHKYIRVESFLSGEECLKNIDRKPDIIIQDYLLDGITGIDVLKATKKKYPDTEFVFLSSQDNIEIAINSIKYGACDYIVKDQHALTKLTNKISKIIADHEVVETNKSFKNGVTYFIAAIITITVVGFVLNYFFPKTFTIFGL